MEQHDYDVTEWTGAPRMDTGAPMPGIALKGDRLFVAYIVARDENTADAGEFAVVRFDGVLQHTFGYPNDEALGGHPLHPAGLQSYAFNEIADSPYLRELGARNTRAFIGGETLFSSLEHWIVTFHDETLEVVGNSVRFLGVVDARSADEAIAKVSAREPA